MQTHRVRGAILQERSRSDRSPPLRRGRTCSPARSTDAPETAAAIPLPGPGRQLNSPPKPPPRSTPTRWCAPSPTTWAPSPRACSTRTACLWESTGPARPLLRAQGEVLETGEVLRAARPARSADFGEGVVRWGRRLYQLTWQEHFGYVYDARTSLKVQGRVPLRRAKAGP